MTRTDAPLDDLTAEDARRILSALSPVLERLRGIARSGRRVTPPGLSDRSGSQWGERTFRSAPNEPGPASRRSTESGPGPEGVRTDSRRAPPELGQLSLATARDLVEKEWHRRSGRDGSSGDERFRSLISSLLIHGLDPEDPLRESAARQSLEEARRALQREGRSTEHVDRECHAISGALWHVLLTADIPVERAIAMRETIDTVLLDGLEAAHGVLFGPGEARTGADTSP